MYKNNQICQKALRFPMSVNSDEDLNKEIDVTISEESSDHEVDVTSMNGDGSFYWKHLKRDRSYISVFNTESGMEKCDTDEPDLKRPRLEADSSLPSVTFKDFKGFPTLVQTLNKLILHMKHCRVYKCLGITPPRGVLLHGPPGCGKSLLAHAIAGELKVPIYEVSASDLLGYMAYNKVNNIFHSATQNAPSVVLIDKLEVAADRKDITRQIVSSLENLNQEEGGDKVMLVGTTTCLESVDSTLRRTGRFDREIHIGMPDRAARKEILTYLTLDTRIEERVSLEEISEITPGFSPGDLKYLITEAAILTIDRAIENKLETVDSNQQNEKSNPSDSKTLGIIETSLLNDEEIDKLRISMNDIIEALKNVQPSTKRLGFAAVPDVTWDDVGSMKTVRKQLETSILLPVKHPKEFEKLGIKRPAGILLCGPPGCGKTLVAKAVANEASVNFLSVKGPELLSMYVGESERAVRTTFLRASASRPCIIFFDEVDSLCPKRCGSSDGSSITARVVNQVLTEMDGFGGRDGVYILAATNRPDILDPALLRPGRFDQVIYVGLPSAEDRSDILRALTRRCPLRDVDLLQLAKDPLLEGYSGADLSALIKESSVRALLRHMEENSELVITKDIIYQVARNLRPSISETELAFYKNMKTTYGQKIESSRRSTRSK